MTKTQRIKNHCKQLKLSGMADHLDPVIAEAQAQSLSYLELVKRLIDKELAHREEKALQRRTKLARLPAGFNLDAYDYTASGALEKQQLGQLRELAWLEQNFNLILMGPSGTGYVNHMIM
jgi:DNA replication protein DnaC